MRLCWAGLPQELQKQIFGASEVNLTSTLVVSGRSVSLKKIPWDMSGLKFGPVKDSRDLFNSGLRLDSAWVFLAWHPSFRQRNQ